MVVDMERFRVSASVDGLPDDFTFKRIYTSGCGRGVIFHNPLDVLGKAPLPDGFTIPAARLVELMKEFSRNPLAHGESGGVHGAALASVENILIVREDIGRHNAIDKVIGAALAAGICMSDKVLLTTGRVSSEIFSKVLRARIPVVAALGGPTNQAVRLARVTNITLAGKLRGSRGEIYSAEQRII
jgi:FdhD protein